MKRSLAERGKGRHDPPLHFAPSKVPETAEGEEDNTKSITVELTKETTIKVKPYIHTNTEHFLLYQKNHGYILSQQDAKPNWDKLDKLQVQAQADADALSTTARSADLRLAAKEKKNRKRLLDLVDTLKLRKSAVVSKAFTLYQQMSGTALRAEWDDIVQDHCFKVGWPMPDGTPATQERGQDWTTLAKCKRLHLLTVCDIDASERNDQYMEVTLRKPPSLPIKIFYKRVKEMDELATMLPCLKDQPDCPSEVVRRNVPMTNFGMCNLLMRNVSENIKNKYHCLHDQVPTDPKKLVEQLTRIEKKLNTLLRGARSDAHRKGALPDNPHRRS